MQPLLPYTLKEGNNDSPITAPFRCVVSTCGFHGPTLKEGIMTLRTLVTVLCAILGLLAITVAGNDSRVAGAADAIVELPVSFQVVNTNTSGAACPSDGCRTPWRRTWLGPSPSFMGRRSA